MFNVRRVGQSPLDDVFSIVGLLMRQCIYLSFVTPSHQRLLPIMLQVLGIHVSVGQHLLISTLTLHPDSLGVLSQDWLLIYHSWANDTTWQITSGNILLTFSTVWKYSYAICNAKVNEQILARSICACHIYYLRHTCIFEPRGAINVIYDGVE